MSQITSSNSETRFWSSVKQAFVQDAITDAAIDQLAFDLAGNNLIDLFARAFHPDANTTLSLNSSASEHASSILPSSGKLTSLLERFVKNLHAIDSRSGVTNPKPERMPGAFEIVKLYATHIYESAVNVRDFQRAFKYNLLRERGTSYLTLLTTLEQLQKKEIPPTVWQLESKTEQLARLISALRFTESDSAITCGGSVSMKQLDTPLVLRYDQGKSSQSKVDFHAADSAAADLHRQIQSLVSQCQEATFGLGGRDVLDKDYRRALKMDPADFSINFHPFDYGIVDCINDLLLRDDATGGLYMQLYKLNIYELGGKFKSHVDTPRSLNQFGSLIVCLPSAHSGGELVIRHQGRTTIHSWGASTSDLAWAAFYSDCEHEVLEVTSGYRITLTYNLYSTSLTEPRAIPPLSIHHIPLFKEVQEALRDPHFLPRGGTIGFHCAHLYPRNRQGSREGVPYCLKGVDRALWMALQSLNIRQRVHLVFDKQKVDDDAQEADELGLDTEDYENAIDPEARSLATELDTDDDSDVEILSEDRGKKYCSAHEPEEYDIVKAYRHQVAESGRSPALEYDNADPFMLPQSTFEKRLDQLLDSRSIKGIDLYPTTPEYPGRDRVSRIFGPARDSHCTAEWDGKTAMLDESTSEIRGIRWLNEQRNMEMALAYLAYGNQAELDTYYASAAILAKIPPYSAERGFVKSTT